MSTSKRQLRFRVSRSGVLAAAVVAMAVSAFGGAGAAHADPDETALAEWWNGKGITGDWFGARDAVADQGLTLNGSWRAIYFGIVASEGGTGNSFTQELVFSARLDFAKLTRQQSLDGLAAFGEVRWREPGHDANPNELIEGSSFFNPSRYAGGTGWRLMNFGLQYTTPEMFGVKNLLTATGGWLQPQKEFIDQPLARLFANSPMASSEALGANIPFSSSFSTWGGTLNIKPVEWAYTKLGLFMSFPHGTDSSNNGLMFEGYAPDTSENGVFLMGETGFTPQVGASKLPGRYAFGWYYYQEDNDEFGTEKYGFYWQADQMLWREPGGVAGELSPQGLRMFSLFNFTPNGFNIRYPFNFQAGLAYEGLVPSRDADQLIAGLAFAEYSEKSRAGKDPAPTNTTFLEAGYRVKVNGWAFIQPFVQVIARPEGVPDVANAAILGVFAGVDF